MFINMIFLLMAFNVKAQQSEIDKIAKTQSLKGSTNWIDLKENLSIHPERLFNRFKDVFGLSPNDEMKLINVVEDANGSKHYKFQQYYSLKIP